MCSSVHQTFLSEGWSNKNHVMSRVTFDLGLNHPVWNEGGVHGTCAVHNFAPANMFTSILVHILSNVQCTKNCHSIQVNH